MWVRVDAAGKLVLDGAGRAEMKYRPNDTKTYRPGASNLTADAAAEPGTPTVLQDEDEDKEPAPTNVVNIWTDGACSGNPGPMGIGMVATVDGKRGERGEYLGVGTNNIAELTAIRRGLELAMELGAAIDRPFRVHSDSGYSIGVLSLGWKAKANQELVAGLRKFLAQFPDVRLVKVRGHAGIPENERCDELARNAITMKGTV